MNADFAQLPGRHKAPVDGAKKSFDIITCFASKFLSINILGVRLLKRTATGFALICAITGALSCGGYSAPQAPSTGLTFRAFVSQDVSAPVSSVFPSGVSAGLFIINATNDLNSNQFISTGNDAGMLVLSPNRSLTLAVSTSNGDVAIVGNAAEKTTGSGITLPGVTESIAISSNDALGYAAVRNASFTGQAPGGVFLMNLSSGAANTSTSIPGAHYVSLSHNGNRLLVFSDDSDSISIVNTASLGTFTPPTLTVGGFDRPVFAFFSADDATAYVLNCGPECGGRSAGVQVFDLNTNLPVGDPIPVDGATVGFVSGSTLYVAGTPQGAGAACAGVSTAATTCGRLDVVDLNSQKVVGSYVISDGYHGRMDLSANGQLYIGAKNCTNINVSGGEVRGCLSIFNTASPGVVVPPQIGDVTGLQAISGRNICYVAQNGLLFIYDTTTNKLGPTQLILTGQIIDVKLVDF